jgi:uncharacterized membrane protein
LLFVWFVVFLVAHKISTPGIPPGNDAMAHLFKLWFIGKDFSLASGIPSWLPYWYNGTDLLKFYQPLFYIVTLPFYLVSKDPIAAYKGIAFMWVGLMSLSMYAVVYRRLGLFPAVVGGILYALAPINIRAWFHMGLLPQAFSYVFLPVVFYFTLRLADMKEYRARSVALLACAWALFILAHPMSAAFSMMAIFVFIAVYQTARKEPRHPLVVTRYILSAALGIGAAGLWFIPAYFGKIMPPAADEAIMTSSVGLGELLGFVSRQTGPNVRFIPIALLVLAVAAVLWRRSAFAWGLGAMGLFTIVFALGFQTPLYGLLPLAKAIFPEYALFGACFAAAFLAARLFERTKRGTWRDIVTVAALVLMVMVSIYEGTPAYSVIENRPVAADIPNALADIKKMPADGRISLLGRSYAVALYYIPIVSGRTSTDGFFYQGTDHFKEIANLNDVGKKKYDAGYAHRKLALWNTRYILAQDQYIAGVPEIVPPGFVKTGAYGPWVVYASGQDANYYQVMDRKTIAIGKNPSMISLQYPWVVEGGQYVDDYDWKYLSRFDRIILAGFSFRDRKTAIDLITRLAESGKTVVMDLQGVQSEFGTESVSFMDILPMPVTLSEDVTLKTARTTAAGIGTADLDVKGLEYGGEPWKTVLYRGLDENIYTIRYQGNDLAALGIKKVGAGQIYLVGANLFFHSLITDDPGAKTVTDWLAGEKQDAVDMAAFPVKTESWNNEDIMFTYESDKETPVVVSTTWTANWRAAIDGQKVEAQDFENLPLLFLPAGKHKVEFTYGTTPLEIFATLISVLSIIVIMAILIRSASHQIRSGYTGL